MLRRTGALKKPSLQLRKHWHSQCRSLLAWPCVIAEANFEQNTITLEMQCSDYKVGAGQHWLYTTPPQRPWVLQREWVDLTDEEIDKWTPEIHGVIREVIAQFKEKNNG
jgi:hypothetical protein